MYMDYDSSRGPFSSIYYQAAFSKACSNRNHSAFLSLQMSTNFSVIYLALDVSYWPTALLIKNYNFDN